MQRRVRLALSDLTHHQRFTAAAMRSVAGYSWASALAMLDAADDMKETARVALAEARRQLSDVGALPEPTHAR